MKQYKINIHAHSIFSDGLNTPYIMALEAKRLGFTSLVITDHFYGFQLGKNNHFSMTVEKMKMLKRACIEAKKILPVIVGLEIPHFGQEVLVFGGEAIKNILKKGLPTHEGLIALKRETNCAIVLCHPSEDFDILELIEICDGYEQYNSGCDLFRNNRNRGGFRDKVSWCNSDAHHADSLEVGYNVVDSKITTESDLIKYIKSGKQPLHFLKGDKMISVEPNEFEKKVSKMSSDEMKEASDEAVQKLKNTFQPDDLIWINGEQVPAGPYLNKDNTLRGV